MSFSLNLQLQATVLETLSGVPDASQSQVRHDGFNRKFTKKNTDVASPCSIDYSKTLTGTQTVDLTALPTINGTVDCTGKKLRALLITNPSANAGKLQVGPGALNPYPLFGAAVTKDLQKDGTHAEWFGDGLAAVAAGAKTITFTPTNPADTYNVQLILG